MHPAYLLSQPTDKYDVNQVKRIIFFFVIVYLYDFIANIYRLLAFGI